MIGRGDTVLKVRGFRISPEEVETVLRGQAGVTDALVAAEGPDADRRLVAYVSPAGADASALRDLCRRLLPPYLVPEEVRPLARIHRLPSGKLDRSRLPERPDAVGSDAAAAVPGGPGRAGQIAAEAVARITGRAVTPRTRLADLALNSLRMVRLHAEIRERAAVPVTVVELFGCATVADIANLLAAGDTAVADGGDRGRRERETRARLAARSRARPARPVRPPGSDERTGNTE